MMAPEKKNAGNGNKKRSTSSEPDTNKQVKIWTFVSEQLIGAAHYIRIFHWTTQEYHAHKISGKLYKKMNEHIDQITEVLIGRNCESDDDCLIKEGEYERIKTPSTPTNDRKLMAAFLSTLATHLQSKKSNSLGGILTSDPALASVRDTLLKDIFVSIYLLNMK